MFAVVFVVVCLWLCVCGCVFVVVFVVVCLWFCVCGCVLWSRSGREHWARMVVVEVRQGTMGADGRGGGPAGNNGRGWSWLRSGREQWARMVVVEVRQGTLGVDGRG